MANVETIENGLRKQVPSIEGNWLYRDFSADDRCFSKVVYLGVNDTEWAECTNEGKEQWEEEHPQEEDLEE